MVGKDTYLFLQFTHSAFFFLTFQRSDVHQKKTKQIHPRVKDTLSVG